MTTKKVRAPKSTAKQEKRANGQGSIYFDHKKNRYIVAVPDQARPNKRRKKFFYSRREAETFLFEYLQNRGVGKATFEHSEFMSWYVGQDYHLGCVLRAKGVICIKLKIYQPRWWLPDVDSG